MNHLPFSPDRRSLLAALAAAACGSVRAYASQRKAWPRQRATPALQLPALDGSTWSLAATRGQPLLLNFWATWCEPCRTEMPWLQELAARHAGLQVLAINYKEGEAAVRRFVDASALRLPVLFDRDGAAAKALDVHTFPSTLAIDRKGRILFTVTGEFDWRSAQAERWVAEIL